MYHRWGDPPKACQIDISQVNKRQSRPAAAVLIFFDILFAGGNLPFDILLPYALLMSCLNCALAHDNRRKFAATKQSVDALSGRLCSHQCALQRRAELRFHI